MEKMNREEFIKYFNLTESQVQHTFPKFAVKKLKEGILIEREGKGQNTIYTITQVEPKEVDTNFFAKRKTVHYKEDLKGEIWTSCYLDNNYSVSNLGRIRYELNNHLLLGSITSDGYREVSINDTNYKVHRIVLQSFKPRKDFNNLIVDHINGIRNDNRLENLRWASNEENTEYKIINRDSLQKELTRIINKFGYDKTYELLKKL